MTYQEARTTALDLFDGKWLWRSDRSGVLYRRTHGRGWEMFYEGKWQQCFDSGDRQAYYGLYATYGETFIRVGEVR